MYKLPLKGNAEWLPTRDVVFHLLKVVEDVETRPFLAMERRVQILTSDDRSRWFANRQKLLELDKSNGDVMEAIESSLMVICLDAEVQNSTDASRSRQDMFRQRFCSTDLPSNGVKFIGSR